MSPTILKMVDPMRVPIAQVTALEKRGRKHGLPWLTTIVLKADTEPVELIMALQLSVCGLQRILFPGAIAYFIPEARLVGVILFVVGSLGFIGLSTRSMSVRATFAFLGAPLRFWAACVYFELLPHDTAWVTYLAGAVMLWWVAGRLACRKNIRKFYAA